MNTRSHWKFVSFLKLKILFRFLQDWVEALGEQFSTAVFVFGLRYRAIKIKARALISFLLGMAKLVIWITKKIHIFGQGWTDVVLSFKGLVASRMKVEHGFYSVTCITITMFYVRSMF